ncbi:MAG: hypothetical protein WBM62_23125 [Crocosphaera sp.]
MFRKSCILSLICLLGFTSSKVSASSFPPPIYNNLNGFSEYYSFYRSLLGKTTSKGYLYCICRPYFRFRIDPLFEDGSVSEIPFNEFTTASYSSSSQSCTYRDNFEQFFTFVPIWVQYVIDEAERRNADTNNTWYPFYAPVEEWISSFTVSWQVSVSKQIEYGCNIPPEEEEEEEKKDPSCPNLFIRGLPFIRNTVTCILKNR